MTISEMLARNGRMHSDKIALIERVPSQHMRKQLTWKGFDDRVNRIANALVARGVRKGDRVLHWMMNSTAWLEAYFGIVRTGAVVAPLNFRFSERDYGYCEGIAEPKLAVIDELFLDRVEAAGYQALPKEKYVVNGKSTAGGMENYEELIARSSSKPVDVEIEMEDPCGLYFTSGTTGDPKPIVLTHRNIEQACIIEVAHGMRKAGDIFAILKPLYHTGDYIHWLSSLILGETAVIQGDKITPQVIFELIQEERCSVAMLLVPWIQDILTELETGKIDQEDYDLTSWRLLLLGAQPVPPNLIKLFHDKFPHVQWDMNYGLTEATGPGCIHLNMGDKHKIGSIGKPGFNWEARIVNENGEDLEKEEVGEIIVKGNGVMKEYYKNPQKTAETIRGGWLYSGDMGKIDNDGYFWLVDRKKDIIISGGENIYPVEIEETLQCHPKVHDVGVIGLPDDRLGEIVTAVIQLKPNVDSSTETETEIMRYCEEKLPRYKRPKHIIFDAVLRNPTGKIEKFRMREKYRG